VSDGTFRADGGAVMEKHSSETEPKIEREPLYDRSVGRDLSQLLSGWLAPRFADELADHSDAGWAIEEYRVAEVYNPRTQDEALELLLVASDGTRMFIGEDLTARDSNGLYGYVIQPDDRLPLVRTTQEALDLLKPAQAASAEMEDVTPIRQGEWFLVPTDEVPVSDHISGEVSQRPFGGSPLENHVPTEYALGVDEDEFVRRFEAACPELEGRFDTPQEVFQRVQQAFEIAQVEDVELETDVPSFDSVREMAEPIFVRGTLRHRENDHYMERIGEDWHLAVTHDVDVFTIDTDELQEEQPTVRLD